MAKDLNINVFVGKAFPHGTISTLGFGNAEMSSSEGTLYVQMGDSFDPNTALFSFEIDNGFCQLDYEEPIGINNLFSSVHADVHLVSNALWLSSYTYKGRRSLPREVNDLIKFHLEEGNGCSFNDDYIEFGDIYPILMHSVHDNRNAKYINREESKKYLKGESYSQMYDKGKTWQEMISSSFQVI